jgi:hypothetical protein
MSVGRPLTYTLVTSLSADDDADEEDEEGAVPGALAPTGCSSGCTAPIPNVTVEDRMMIRGERSEIRSRTH